MLKQVTRKSRQSIIAIAVLAMSSTVCAEEYERTHDLNSLYDFWSFIEPILSRIGLR